MMLASKSCYSKRDGLWRISWPRESDLLERVSEAGLVFYRKADWGDLRHGIFTRHGGASESPYASLNLGASIGDDLSAVKENHRRMYRALAVNPQRAVSCWLVHSVKTLAITGGRPQNGKLEKADAIITDQADLPLVMRYADCVPLLMYDPVRRSIGLGHAGWRGTVQGMAGKMIREMRAAFGCNPEDVRVLIGPAISRRNYAVGAEVVRAVDHYFGEDAGLIALDAARGSPTFDLWRANQQDLAKHGVANVDIMETCTFENTGEFYSHRAENGRTGRFGVVISL